MKQKLILPENFPAISKEKEYDQEKIPSISLEKKKKGLFHSTPPLPQLCSFHNEESENEWIPDDICPDKGLFYCRNPASGKASPHLRGGLSTVMPWKNSRRVVLSLFNDTAIKGQLQIKITGNQNLFRWKTWIALDSDLSSRQEMTASSGSQENVTICGCSAFCIKWKEISVPPLCSQVPIRHNRSLCSRWFRLNLESFGKPSEQG